MILNIINKGIFYSIEFIKAIVFIALMALIMFAITRCTISKNITKAENETKITANYLDTSGINTNTFTTSLINNNEVEIIKQTEDTYTAILIPGTKSKSDTTIIVKGQKQTQTIKAKKQLETKQTTEVKEEKKAISNILQLDQKTTTNTKQVERDTIYSFFWTFLLLFGGAAVLWFIFKK